MIEYPKEWDDIIEEAEKDNRVGDKSAVVTEVKTETWPSGDARFKIMLVLPDAGNAKADITLSDPPSAERIAQVKASGEQKTFKGLAMGITLHKTMRQHYGKTAATDFKAGDKIRVKTVKNKEGFIRVVAFLPPAVSITDTKDIGF